MTRILALLVVLVVAFTTVGCGNDETQSPSTNAPSSSEPTGTDSAEKPSGEALSEPAYITAVNAAQSEFATKSGKLNLANPSGPKDFKKSLDKVGELIDTLVADLETITPPASVTTQHQKLIDIMSEYGEALDKDKNGLTSSDQAEVKRAATAIQKASTIFAKDFDATINDVNRVIKP